MKSPHTEALEAMVSAADEEAAMAWGTEDEEATAEAAEIVREQLRRWLRCKAWEEKKKSQKRKREEERRRW